MDVDLKAWKADMTSFATAHACELAAEIVEWHDSGVLRDGRLRELMNLAAPVATHDALAVAEHFAIRAVLERAATQPTEDGGAHG